MVLFVRLRAGEQLSANMVQAIKNHIRQTTTPRHVPEVILQVGDIPYTRSGKKMELAVAQLINGGELSHVQAVANPQCLAEYRELGERLL